MSDRLPAELIDALLLTIIDSNPAMTAPAFASREQADDVAMKITRIWSALRAAVPLADETPPSTSPPAAS